MKDIQVEVEIGTLPLKGERQFESRERGAGCHRIQRSYGTLTVTLPRKGIAKPRTIQVQVQ